MAERIAQAGNLVSVHYKGTFDDGTVFDSSLEREPITFTVGQGQMIPGFDAAVNGLSIGQEVNIRIEPQDAYGEHLKENIVNIPLEFVPKDVSPKIGDFMQLKNPEGQVFDVQVIDLNEKEIVLDANHPMAGKVLNFFIRLEEIH